MTRGFWPNRQALAGWEFYQGHIAECDRALEQVPKEIKPGDSPPPDAPTWGRRNGVNAPKIAGLHGLICQLCGGKDPTAIPGISDYTLLQLVAETGTDLAANWKTEKYFTAWLGVAPGSRPYSASNLEMLVSSRPSRLKRNRRPWTW